MAEVEVSSSIFVFAPLISQCLLYLVLHACCASNSEKRRMNQQLFLVRLSPTVLQNLFCVRDSFSDRAKTKCNLRFFILSDEMHLCDFIVQKNAK